MERSGPSLDRGGEKSFLKRNSHSINSIELLTIKNHSHGALLALIFYLLPSTFYLHDAAGGKGITRWSYNSSDRFTTTPMPSSLTIRTGSPLETNSPSATTSTISPSISAFPAGRRSVSADPVCPTRAEFSG